MQVTGCKRVWFFFRIPNDSVSNKSGMKKMKTLLSCWWLCWFRFCCFRIFVFSLFYPFTQSLLNRTYGKKCLLCVSVSVLFLFFFSFNFLAKLTTIHLAWNVSTTKIWLHKQLTHTNRWTYLFRNVCTELLFSWKKCETDWKVFSMAEEIQ